MDVPFPKPDSSGALAFPEPGRVANGWAAVRLQGEDVAHKLYAYEALDSPSAGPEEPAEPYTLPWFVSIENRRHTRHGRWIPKLLEFAKHGGETLLGLGDGLGTDWLQYARNGASVIVCNRSAAQLGLVRRNFELRNLPARFLHAEPACLPLESASIDVACITSLPGVGDTAQAVVDEVFRVLKPGGKVLAVAPAKYDVDFWTGVLLPLYRLLEPHRFRRSRESCYSGRGLKRLFQRFVEHRVHKRQLRRSDLPHLWRCVPAPLLERLLGRMLILKAFKPVSSAISRQLPAAA